MKWTNSVKNITNFYTTLVENFTIATYIKETKLIIKNLFTKKAAGRFTGEF